MPPTTHKCSKEAEIAVLKEQMNAITSKVNDIHTILTNHYSHKFEDIETKMEGQTKDFNKKIDEQTEKLNKKIDENKKDTDIQMKDIQLKLAMYAGAIAIAALVVSYLINHIQLR